MSKTKNDRDDAVFYMWKEVQRGMPIERAVELLRREGVTLSPRRLHEWKYPRQPFVVLEKRTRDAS